MSKELQQDTHGDDNRTVSGVCKEAANIIIIIIIILTQQHSSGMTITGVVYLPGCRSLSHHICQRRRGGGGRERTQTRDGHHGNTQTHTQEGDKDASGHSDRWTDGQTDAAAVQIAKSALGIISSAVNALVSQLPVPPASLCPPCCSCSSSSRDYCVLALLLRLFSASNSTPASSSNLPLTGYASPPLLFLPSLPSSLSPSLLCLSPTTSALS